MKRLVNLVAVAVLVFLVLSIIPNAFAATELAYDDGTATSSSGAGVLHGVRFSLPSGVHSARILTVRYQWSFNPGIAIIHVTGPDHLTELTPAITTTYDLPGGWKDVDVSSLNIVVTGDFWVILDESQKLGNALCDASNDAGRSFGGNSLANLANNEPGDLLLRVVIEDLTSPVGGVLMPVNKLEIISPYLALAGLIIAVSAVVVVKRRKV